VLAGKPNAGKSSLFNALLGNQASLVSAQPGTTRDYLEAVVQVDGVAIELLDTAGIGSPACSIDAAAQDLGRERRAQADLVLWCAAADEPADYEMSSDTLQVATKIDRAAPPAGALPTSAITGEGLAELRARLCQEARQSAHAALAPSVSRCSHHADACWQHLQHAHELVMDECLPELLALQIRLAVEELGAMVGAVYTDDLLDRIFSRFCIGK
jgi:tRNA modification GTPase